jgi:two-component system nitrogen regulation response regulator GlnG
VTPCGFEQRRRKLELLDMVCGHSHTYHPPLGPTPGSTTPAGTTSDGGGFWPSRSPYGAGDRLASAVADPPQALAAPRPRSHKPADITEDELVEALRTHRWDIKSTAAAFGISRTSLYELMETFGLRTAGQLDVDELRACHRELGGDLDAMVERLRVSRPALRRRIRELGLS